MIRVEKYMVGLFILWTVILLSQPFILYWHGGMSGGFWGLVSVNVAWWITMIGIHKYKRHIDNKHMIRLLFKRNK